MRKMKSRVLAGILLLAMLVTMVPELPAKAVNMPATLDPITMYANGTGTVAVGGTMQIQLCSWDPEYEEKIVWSSSDESVLQITSAAQFTGSKGTLTQENTRITISGKRTGTVQLNCKFYNSMASEDFYEKTMTITVTNPSLTKTTYYAWSDQEKVEIAGITPDSWYQYQVDISNTKVVRAYESAPGYLYPVSKGTATVGISIDGKYIGRITVVVKIPKLKNEMYYSIQKKKSRSYAVTGLDSHYKVKYRSSNRKIATISSKGKVKAKNKYGSTRITIEINGKEYRSFLLTVSKKKADQAITAALKLNATHPKYSQKKRMQKKYVDCSSFTWKSYKKAKVTFGSNYYAPTAASIAYWCKKNGKILKMKDTSYEYLVKRLKPGDLIFCTKMQKKEYKGIGHVCIYAGNGIVVGTVDGGTGFIPLSWYCGKNFMYGRPA